MLVLMSFMLQWPLAVSLSFGLSLSTSTKQEDPGRRFDVIIVGGSSAGLSAALSLGRSLRSVMVLDAGSPCNAEQPWSHNMLTRDGQQPSWIADCARRDVAVYPTVAFSDQTTVTKIVQQQISDDAWPVTFGFCVFTSSPADLVGSYYLGRKLIIATGVKDLLPESIIGLRECWSKSVIHCPYCHGYEWRGRKTALLMDISNVRKMAPIVRTLTNELCVIVCEGAESEKDKFSSTELE